MKKNMGMLDKLIRVSIAFTIGLLHYFKVINGLVGTIFLLVALFLSITALFNFSPLYSVFGINTCKVKK